MTRDDALKKLESPTYDESLRAQDHQFIAKKLGVSVSELEEIFSRPPVDHLDYPNDVKRWGLALKFPTILRKALPDKLVHMLRGVTK